MLLAESWARFAAYRIAAVSTQRPATCTPGIHPPAWRRHGKAPGGRRIGPAALLDHAVALSPWPVALKAEAPPRC